MAKNKKNVKKRNKKSTKQRGKKNTNKKSKKHKNPDQRRMLFFKTLKKLNKNQRKSYLSECPDSNIHTICHACYNLSNNTIPYEKSKKYMGIEKYIKRLGKQKTSVKSKRRLLQKQDQVGSGILSLIATTVLPFLVRDGFKK